MLEGRDIELPLAREAHEHQDLVGAVAVHVHAALALQHLHQGLELQVAARLGPARGGPGGTPRAPAGGVFLGRGKAVLQHLLDAHARGRVARAGAEVRALDVFTQRELDAGLRAFEDQRLRIAAPAQLDDLALPADGVGRTVQHVGRGQAAGELAVDRHVGGVQHIGHAHFGGDGVAELVDAARHRDMRVGVDEAGREVLAAGVNELGTGRRREVAAHRRDAAGAHQHVGLRQRAGRALRPHRGIAQQQGCGLLGQRGAQGAGRPRGRGRWHGRIGGGQRGGSRCGWQRGSRGRAVGRPGLQRPVPHLRGAEPALTLQARNDQRGRR